ncbi:helix-turn-helix transcriptional regulator [Mucilaginibacter psychrotolerans]|uniref:Plasmid maintenance system antidote protein n=1 Tax=Mucilaginibacter psychrotolerans TaxID=1524096 RepID=A0A4Y8S800_9SPHI|nr:plasmid maintenance system antidote protein [Mucilaginibacter psychrotolerans]TFF35022.1 plasmid maintenance system antidote protein [Mucilaginibacter psychrotolerans]
MHLLIKKYQGIHPGLILERELKKRNIKKGPFALSLKEYPQTLNEITKGRRALTPSLSLKIDGALELPEGTMLVLQAHYEIKKEKQKAASAYHPNLSILRKILFWDTDIDKINWQEQKDTVIKRVFERGNDEEKKEIIRFYGRDEVNSVVGNREDIEEAVANS